MGMHFNTSGPYKLNTVKQQMKIMSRWSRKLYTVIATQACCSHHILKFVWSETPAPKWLHLLRVQYNNNSLGMNNSQAEKPRRRKQAHCWIQCGQQQLLLGLAASLLSGPYTPPVTIPHALTSSGSSTDANSKAFCVPCQMQISLFPLQGMTTGQELEDAWKSSFRWRQLKKKKVQFLIVDIFNTYSDI